MGVHEQIDVPAHCSGVVADAAVERRMSPLKFLKHGTQARRRECELRGAAATVAQRRGNVDPDRGSSGHEVHGCESGQHKAG